MFFPFVYKKNYGVLCGAKTVYYLQMGPRRTKETFSLQKPFVARRFFCFYVCSITLVASMKRPSTIRFLMNVLTQSAISKGPSMFFLIVCLFHLVFPRTGIKYMVFHTDWEFVQPRPYKLSWIDAYWYKDLEI